MRVLLGELAPRVGAPEENLAKIRTALEHRRVDLAVFPELFLSGYRPGDRLWALGLAPADPIAGKLQALAEEVHTHIAVGAPLRSVVRPGELHNAVLLVPPEGPLAWQVKRYLPSYGPFEEGHFFSPTDHSRPIPVAGHPVGFAICYDTFFPEVFRELSLKGAKLLVIVSASPVTSRKLFEKLLPARAVENACPVLYANRVGVEDGIVFGGGSGGWDVRGEPLSLSRTEFPGGTPEELLLEGEVDLDQSERWRPFRPVLRDLDARPGRHRPGESEPVRGVR
jgi:predicted amidohydrolase